MENREVGCQIKELEKELGIAEGSVSFEMKDEILYLEGNLDGLQIMVDFCHKAAKIPGVKNLVSHIRTPESKPVVPVDLEPYQKKGVLDSVDVAIIGAGVTGCAAARTLSKYDKKILVLEKESDICEGTTKANNGMVHSGYDSKPGSLKALCNVEGNAMYSQWAEELGFHFNRTGSFVCGFNEEDMKAIQGLYENGVKNKVPGIKVIDGTRAREIEPNLSDQIIGALWTPSAGYVEPYEVTLALAENAVDNGVRFLLNTPVLGILREGDQVTGVVTDKGVIQTKAVINAAGLYADDIARMAGDEFYTIHPRRGTLVIFDKENRGKLHTFAGKAPGNYTKGGGPQETPEGTLLWGPSAKEVADKEDMGVDQDDLDFVIEKGLELTKNISQDTLITYFSGNRAATFQEDFVIENSKKLHGFMHVAGIQSPGLASAPAIAKRVEKLFLELMPKASVKADFDPIRAGRKPFRECSNEMRQKMIQENPAYGRIICRCETVTEGEILDAIHGKIPAHTVDAVKRRTRAGMGRCQGGFCGGKVVDILARELKIPPNQVTLKGNGSEILKNPTRQSQGGEQE
ncbi:MAG: NAD(P)/FAD-dependent oxidoreductase [Lachnospiraceae bacterium]|nr:NAD(P)/FAD-dependent oxidoreductase [Lachnospiraceae bacterium]